MKPRVSDEPKGKLSELEAAQPKKLLSIDWTTIVLASEADALAVWKQIAPTGEDFEAKLEEIPNDSPIASQLALALLRGGNFTCAPPQPKRDCPSRVASEVEPPLPQASLDDPCLRRMVALWALEALDDADLPAAFDALRTIAAIPPPESQLVAAALDAYPASDQDRRLELRAIALAAGHRELVNGKLSDLDDAHLVAAVQKHHIDGALEALSAVTHRSVFVSAITDDKLAPAARAAAMIELASTLETKMYPRDVQSALVSATKASDCQVAATARRMLAMRGELKYGPSRPHARTAPPMMRAMCVLASYELLLREDEPSYLLQYVPPKGVELVRISYDPYSDRDTDGDGDPHTERSLIQVPRNEMVLPEIEDMVKAFGNCDGTVCKSGDREFRFGFKPGAGGELMLFRLEVVERPPCPGSK
jgi:hypothetical protein